MIAASGQCIYVSLNTTLRFKYDSPEGRDACFASFKVTLKEIDDQNAYSRSTNGTAVFGISSTSDVPGATKAGLLGHYGEDFEIDDDEPKTVITPPSPFSRFPGLENPSLRLPKRWRRVPSMTKYDADLATFLTTERFTHIHLNIS